MLDPQVDLKEKNIESKNKKAKVILAFIITIVILTLIFFSVLFFSFNKKQNSLKEIQKQTSLLKIGFLTDWEYGTRRLLGDKMTRKSPSELSKAVFYLNEEFHPNIVIGGGDYIESSAVKPERAREQLEEINEIFSLIKVPRLYAFGNHDLRSLSKVEIKEILGIQESHAIRDIGDWRIIIFDTNFTLEGEDRNAENYVIGGVNQNELNWLREALKTDKPVLVFSHHSPAASVSNGNRIVINMTNDKEVRTILEEAGNVAAVFSGHTPNSYFERLNGINYFICDTLVNINALGSFATIEVEYIQEDRIAKITFKQLGNDKHEYYAEWKYGERAEDYRPDILNENTVPETEEEQEKQEEQARQE